MLLSMHIGPSVVGRYPYSTPAGPVEVLFSDRGVCGVVPAGSVDGPPLRVPPWDAAIAEALNQGRPGRLPLDIDVTPFQRRVLEVTATIPRGEVRTYRWVAEKVGNPRATRAVGNALAANPVPLIVPCHRVVRSDGHMGHYSMGGTEVKVALLQQEGADPAVSARVEAELPHG
jgi:O-6-methylguanine DNA methyltransferase